MGNIGMICGIDEAGRGPWAGPVTAAAVILDPACLVDGLTDSKKLTAERRETLYAEIKASAITYGIGWASPEEIDRMNIREATFLAMKMSLIDSIGLSEYNETTGIPKHRVPWWCERPQTELYLERAGIYSLVSGQSFVPRTQPTRLMRLPGDVVLDFDQFTAQKLEYSTAVSYTHLTLPTILRV